VRIGDHCRAAAPRPEGAPLAAQTRHSGATVLWCPVGRSEATRRRAAQSGLLPAPTLAEALAGSDVVLSICPPEAAEYTAGYVAGHGYRELYLDANASSPHRAVRIVKTVTAAGWRFRRRQEGERMASPILADLGYLPSVAATPHTGVSGWRVSVSSVHDDRANQWFSAPITSVTSFAVILY
jgi:hypothetical protein